MMWLAIIWLACFACFVEIIACAEHEPPWFDDEEGKS
jgi:hypothetical protein